jgi:hypothetical protein
MAFSRGKRQFTMVTLVYIEIIVGILLDSRLMYRLRVTLIVKSHYIDFSLELLQSKYATELAICRLV